METTQHSPNRQGQAYRAKLGSALLALALPLTLTTGPATALSCIQPDAVRTYIQARDSEDTYIVVDGRLTDAHRVPAPEASLDGTAPPETEGVVQLKGHYLTSTGFDKIFDQPIILRLTCIASWCPHPPQADRALLFLKKTPDGYRLDFDACASWLVPSTSQARQRLIACHRHQRCN